MSKRTTDVADILHILCASTCENTKQHLTTVEV